MQLGVGAACIFVCMFLVMCLHEVPFEDKNAHGMPFEAIPLGPLATWVVNEKGSCVARPQSEKVLTHGFLAKKESVWHDLS